MMFVPLVGCGGRIDFEPASSEGGHGGVCIEQQPATPVPDCTRATPSAIPIARLFDGTDAFHLATDGESLYYVSEGRVFRMSMTDRVPEALTPQGTFGVQVTYADGFVYWQNLDGVHRVPAEGGLVEPLVELPFSATWAVAGDAILSSGPSGHPSPLYRTSLTTDETTEIIAEDPVQFISRMHVDGDRVLVRYSNRLVAVPATGGDVEVLASMFMVGAEPPRVDETHIYFGARPGSTAGLHRIPRDGSSAPELFLRGTPIAVAFAGDSIFANVVPNLENGEEETIGELVRAPLDGGAPEHITFTDARGKPYSISLGTGGLVVSDCTLYFIERCSDETELRLVALPRPDVD
ncbi:hypothetical protein [Polyangium aurulentum]|uniref:hypothetical protein n=1 Tax=Polyangium aurulentum TaxID=2567896 RepID=UPI00200F6D0C|nr:hypothetical protein [Polyangium aurulentum]UQA56961.1 hypothetical protein E8A73_037565 [Polyangium aurulentum]